MSKPFTSETGQAAQAKSVESRLQNRTIRERTALALGLPLKDKDRLREMYDAGYPKKQKYTASDYLIFKVCGHVVEKGKPDDLLKLMEITGEDTESAIVEDSAAYFEAGELTDADREND